MVKKYAALSALLLVGGTGLLTTTTPAHAAPRVAHRDNQAAVDDLHRATATKREARDWNGVIALCQKTIALDSMDADAYADMAEAQAAKGLTGEAARSFRLSVGEDPNQNWSSCRQAEGDLQFRFAAWLVKVGYYEDAVRMYTVGRKWLDKDAGRDLLREKWSGKEIAANETERKQFLAAIHSALGLHYIATPANAETNRALGEFTLALSLTPDNAIAQWGRGTCLQRKGQKSEAQTAFQKAVQVADRHDIRARAEESLALLR